MGLYERIQATKQYPRLGDLRWCQSVHRLYGQCSRPNGHAGAHVQVSGHATWLTLPVRELNRA